MARVGRAFIFASSERYISLLINLSTTAILSRLLTPAEFGIVIIGFAVAAIADGVRELSAATYVVQAPTINRSVLRTVFTVNAGLTLLIAATLFALATPLSHFYGLPRLEDFLRVFTLGFALGPVASPIGALMVRDMEFGRLTAAVLVVNLFTAAASIVFALRGLSFMSLAWAYVVSNAVSSIIYPAFLRDWTGFGLSLAAWREVLKFGVFGGATRLLYVVNDNINYLVLGRFISPAGIGLLYRGGMIASFPERVLLGGAGAVALPAFSEQVRNGVPLGPIYVRSIENITAVYWPATIVIGALAYPIVAIFLGDQWRKSAVYAQIFAGALLFNAPTTLNYPVQVASGAIRHTSSLALFHVLVSITTIAIVAPYGPLMIAWSFWLIMPINVAASVWLVSRVAPFSVSDFVRALCRSWLVTLATAFGPLVVVAISGTFDLPLRRAFMAVLLAASGWVIAMKLTGHPLLEQSLGYFSRIRARLSAS